MLDTIAIYRDAWEIGFLDSRRVILGRLANVKYETSEDGVSSIRGTIGGNMQVFVTDGRIEIIGSIGKFYKGKPLYKLSQRENIRAVAALGSALGVDVSNWAVSRVDYAENLIMLKTPKTYISQLGCHKGAKASTLGNGTTKRYDGNGWKFQLYDKVEELQRNGERKKIPKGMNVLRVELQMYGSGIRAAFGADGLRLGMLAKADICKELQRRWWQHYQSIYKRTKQINKTKLMEGVKTLKDAKNISAFALVHYYGGVDKLEEHLKMLCKNGQMSAKAKCDTMKWVRAAVKKVCGIGMTGSDTGADMREMDKKIDGYIKRAKAKTKDAKPTTTRTK